MYYRENIQTVKRHIVDVVNALSVKEGLPAVSTTQVVLDVTARCHTDGKATPSKTLILRCVDRLVRAGYLRIESDATRPVGFYYFTKIKNIPENVTVDELFGRIRG